MMPRVRASTSLGPNRGTASDALAHGAPESLGSCSGLPERVEGSEVLDMDPSRGVFIGVTRDSRVLTWIARPSRFPCNRAHIWRDALRRRCRRRLVTYVYILRCADGALYVGSTTDLDARLTRHNQGRGCAFTATRSLRRTSLSLTWLCLPLICRHDLRHGQQNENGRT